MRILNSFSLILILCSVFFLTGMSKRYVIDLSEKPQYKNMVGKSYSSKEELVYFLLQGSNLPKIKPYGVGLAPEKKDLKQKFPFKFHSIKVLGVVPSGTKFSIYKVAEEGDRNFSFVRYYFRVIDSLDANLIGVELNPSEFLTIEEFPKVDSKYFEEIP